MNCFYLAMACLNCSGCMYEGTCLDWDVDITPQVCNLAGGIDCSGKFVFDIISILLTKILYLIRM